jgi:uncharacterized protein (DUF1501 family)
LAAWWSASPDRTTNDGWLGRWLDATNTDGNPLRAVSLGGGASPALRAVHAQSTSVYDLAGFQLRTASRDAAAVTAAFASTASPAATDPLLAAAQQAVLDANDAVRTLGQLAAPPTAVEGEATSDDDAANTDGPLSQGLAAAADLIGLDIGTRVVLVSAGGFDTHANEAATHERLLGDVGHGIASFFAALDATGHADRVLLLTTSEFGRRAQENGSAGTDHGHGGVHFVVGPGARGGLHGAVDLANLADGDLTCAADTRSLYAAGLDWLGGPTDDVLGGTYDRLQLLA